MLRRVISTWVLAGFVVAQWAATPHGHDLGSQTPRDHGALPHVHLGRFAAHHHAHEHGHADRSDGRAVAKHASRTWGLVSLADHDGDAVYLPTTVTVSLAERADQLAKCVAPLLHDVGGELNVDLLTARDAASPVTSSQRMPSPDVCLALRALRI